ncbi:PDR/VanB family oxidoreductase [Lichenifustis flavocetrariae]|uniref:PDR/VanB family oxidoreductase n=1 Tax=Lichenifustis flavocetrariae TaxID=2949735 RepID=A0AA41YV09_9HYPH|nr:PDR/VanB family oxidoreductase [Lichenifustis flavocetrariae]MCW6507830.1 PDR/VanB family oxidoreductase [Lichenifustis flavocetrariae]
MDAEERVTGLMGRAMAQDAELPLLVEHAVFETPDILVLDLVAASGADLPAWDPGAHIDLVLASGLVRQYSLCGDPADRGRYRVAVQREAAGRGGSIEIHNLAMQGSSVATRGPRNHFALVEAPCYLFVAGGIGVTPMLPMIRAAERGGRPWRLVYGGRSRATMGFLSDIGGRRGGETDLLPQDECGLPDLHALLSGLDDQTLVYGCGPGAMLTALEAAAASLGLSERLHIERFAAPEITPHHDMDRPFEVELRLSGLVLQVPADRSLGSVLQDADIPVTFSCQEGYCGSCECLVIEGTPDHRDTILNESEKAEGRIMMVCVGRAHSPRLVLEL